MKTLRRQICPEIKIIDQAKGIAEYVASDETLDSYREIIRADGWRFDHFQKNAPFVDSHDYSSVEKLVGSVIGAEVQGKKLVETVKWATDVPDNKLAQLGWKMTVGGYLKAVSVGFRPMKSVSRWDANPAGFQQEIADMGLSGEQMNVNRIFTEQQQLELSAVIIGANPNALAKAYKAEAITDADIEFFAARIERTARVEEETEAETEQEALDKSALVSWAEARTAEAFLRTFEAQTKKL